jgi:hypothetical protein
METPWQKWKRENAERQQSGKVSPLDFANPNTEYAAEDVADARYEICKECPHFLAITKQCVKCGCFMHLKTKLAHAECPVNKW